MLPKRQLSTKKACQNHFKNNIPIPATEAQARIVTQIESQYHQLIMLIAFIIKELHFCKIIEE